MRQTRHLVASLAIIITLAVAAVLASPSTPPAVAQTTTTPGPVLFEDDFNGPAGASFDPTKWGDYSACSYNSTAAYGMIQCGDNETLDGAGHLSVPATPTAGSSIMTGAKFGFVYGTMSAWMKMPTQTGYWPTFWSLNNNPNGQDVFPIGEVDAMEAFTFDMSVYHAVGHVWTPTDATNYHSPDNYCGRGADLTGAYHKYSATIEPGKISYFFDDQPCGQAFVKDPAKAWGFGPDVTRPNWLLLTLAVGGAGGQNPTPTAPAQMLVDRVEVRGPDTVATTPPTTTTTTTATATTPPTTTTTTTTPATTTTTTPPPPVAPLVNGATYRLTNACGGKVIDVPGSSTTAGTALKTWTWNGGGNQQWKAVAVGNYWKFVNMRSGLVMNVQNGSKTNGAPIIQWNDNGDQNSQWSIKDVGGGYYQIIGLWSGKAVHVHGGQTTDGGVIEQQTVQTPSTCAQKWQITKL
jgi:beta-glucanase (GH16 family)